MRKVAKLLGNFLGATKEITQEYVNLAGITDGELNQIAFTVMQREDRKTTARLLAGKGFSTREIAKITGWNHATIARDLAVANATKAVANATPRPSTTGGREEARELELVPTLRDGRRQCVIPE